MMYSTTVCARLFS